MDPAKQEGQIRSAASDQLEISLAGRERAYAYLGKTALEFFGNSYSSKRAPLALEFPYTASKSLAKYILAPDTRGSLAMAERRF